MTDYTVVFAFVAFIPWMAFAYCVNKLRLRRKINRYEPSLILDLLHVFISLSILAFNVIGAFVVFKWIGGFFVG